MLPLLHFVLFPTKMPDPAITLLVSAEAGTSPLRGGPSVMTGRREMEGSLCPRTSVSALWHPASPGSRRSRGLCSVSPGPTQSEALAMAQLLRLPAAPAGTPQVVTSGCNYDLPPSCFRGHCAGTWCTDIHAGKYSCTLNK